MIGSRNRGVKRLSLVLGLMGVVLWLAACGVAFWLRGAVGDLQEARATIRAETEWLAAYRDSVAAQDEPQGWRAWLRDARAGVDTLTHHIRRNAAEREAAEAVAWLRAALKTVLAGAFVSFLVPWGTVHIIAWIAAGFRQGSG